MGGAVAHEVALRLRDRGREVDRLFVSGRQPPMYHRGGWLHLNDDETLLADLSRLNPANAELLAQRDLMDLLLPAIRCDYRIIETYVPTVAEPLACPITVLLGDRDNELTEDEARDWSQLTRGSHRASRAFRQSLLSRRVSTEPSG